MNENVLTNDVIILYTLQSKHSGSGIQLYLTFSDFRKVSKCLGTDICGGGIGKCEWFYLNSSWFDSNCYIYVVEYLLSSQCRL